MVTDNSVDTEIKTPTLGAQFSKLVSHMMGASSPEQVDNILQEAQTEGLLAEFFQLAVQYFNPPGEEKQQRSTTTSQTQQATQQDQSKQNTNQQHGGPRAHLSEEEQARLKKTEENLARYGEKATRKLCNEVGKTKGGKKVLAAVAKKAGKETIEQCLDAIPFGSIASAAVDVYALGKAKDDLLQNNAEAIAQATGKSIHDLTRKDLSKAMNNKNLDPRIKEQFKNLNKTFVKEQALNAAALVPGVGLATGAVSVFISSTSAGQNVQLQNEIDASAGKANKSAGTKRFKQDQNTSDQNSTGHDDFWQKAKKRSQAGHDAGQDPSNFWDKARGVVDAAKDLFGKAAFLISDEKSSKMGNLPAPTVGAQKAPEELTR